MTDLFDSGTITRPSAALMTTTHIFDATTPLNQIIVPGPGTVTSIRINTPVNVVGAPDNFRIPFHLVDGLPDNSMYLVPRTLHLNVPGCDVCENVYRYPWYPPPGSHYDRPELISIPTPYQRGIVLLSLPPGASYTITTNP